MTNDEPFGNLQEEILERTAKLERALDAWSTRTGDLLACQKVLYGIAFEDPAAGNAFAPFDLLRQRLECIQNWELGLEFMKSLAKARNACLPLNWRYVGGLQVEHFDQVVCPKFRELAQCLREITDNDALWPKREVVQSPGIPVAPAVAQNGISGAPKAGRHGGVRNRPKPPKSPGRPKKEVAEWHEKALRMRSNDTAHKEIAKDCGVSPKTLETFFNTQDKRKRRALASRTKSPVKR